jgi:HEAT repeat protein
MARQEPPKDQRHIGTLAETLDREVRVEALVAAGRLGDSHVIDDVLPLMDHSEVAMREAATFTLGRSGDRRAVPALLKALADHRPSVQTLACLGLAQIDDPRVGPAVKRVLEDLNAKDQVRGACAYAIGARRYAAGIPALLGALDDNRGEAQRLSAWALGQLGEAKAVGPLIRAYFARAGQSADELVWAIGRASGAGLAPAPSADMSNYPMRSGKLDDNKLVADLPGTLPHPAPASKLVVDHASDIAAGLAEALSEHRDVVVRVLEDLDDAPERLALGALTPATGDAKITAALQTIANGIETQVIAQLGSEDPKVRALAISVLAKIGSPKADTSIGKALADPAPQVRASAMTSIVVLAHRRGKAPPELTSALAKMLTAPEWGDRRVAAQAMGKLGAQADVAALAKAATDSQAFVREAVAIALGQAGGPAAAAPLQALAKDDVPEVREAATQALGQLKH